VQNAVNQGVAAMATPAPLHVRQFPAVIDRAPKPGAADGKLSEVSQ